MLHVTTGDANQAELAQDPDSLAGKRLRLTPDGDVPDDNPTAGSPVYALGLRDPQGLAWGSDGTLYASEFGPDRDDEINVITPGANYGWPEVTGVADGDEYVDPIFVRQPEEASWNRRPPVDERAAFGRICAGPGRSVMRVHHVGPRDHAVRDQERPRCHCQR